MLQPQDSGTLNANSSHCAIALARWPRPSWSLVDLTVVVGPFVVVRFATPLRLALQRRRQWKARSLWTPIRLILDRRDHSTSPRREHGLTREKEMLGGHNAAPYRTLQAVMRSGSRSREIRGPMPKSEMR